MWEGRGRWEGHMALCGPHGPPFPFMLCLRSPTLQAVTVDTHTAVLVRNLRSGVLTLVQQPQVRGEGGELFIFL